MPTHDDLLEHLEHVRHLLPSQGPISVFIHHNTLHAFQHLPFHEALKQAGHVYQAQGYYDLHTYEQAFKNGRIRALDLRSILHQMPHRTLHVGVDTHTLYETLLLHPIVEHADAMIQFKLSKGDIRDTVLWNQCCERVRLNTSHDLWPYTSMQANHVFEQPPYLPWFMRLCAMYLDRGVAVEAMPEREHGLWQAWRHLLHSFSFVGAPLWLRKAAADLNGFEYAHDARAYLKARLSLMGEQHLEKNIKSLAFMLPGWAGMFSYLETHPLDNEGHVPASLVEYLAVLLNMMVGDGSTFGRAEMLQPATLLQASWRLYQFAHRIGLDAAAIASLTDEAWHECCSVLTLFDERERKRIWHEAFERFHRDEILGSLIQNNDEYAFKNKTPMHSMYQACFCIDDREEGIRRHLEELEPQCETFGVAGFFGLAMDFQSLDALSMVPLCPVVVTPDHCVVEKYVTRDESKYVRRKRLRRLWAKTQYVSKRWNRFQAVSSVLVPVMGLGAAFNFVGKMWFPGFMASATRGLIERYIPKPRTTLHALHEGEMHAARAKPVGVQLETAALRIASTLQNIGLTKNFAPLICLFGHGASSINNPHRSAYDCGACGGFHGGYNARLFASFANNFEIRLLLRERHHIHIPDTTWFVGALHDTTTDELEFYDDDKIPESMRVAFEKMKTTLHQAAARSALERCRRLESAYHIESEEQALKHVFERSHDLSQARPELGHVTNAVCLIAPRSISRGLFLDRRSFLISYNPQEDIDQSIISRIMAAVVPVCAGINLEYYFSCVDNERLGCGTKLPHNVTSMLGVMNGLASDLRTGLPKQMIEIHEAVRLLIVVACEPNALLAALQKLPEVWQLVSLGWVRMHCFHNNTAFVFEKNQFVVFDGFITPLQKVPNSRAWYQHQHGFVSPAMILTKKAEHHG